MVAYSELLNEVDACVFTGLMLQTNLEEFKGYVDRWSQAIKDYEKEVSALAKKVHAIAGVTVVLGIDMGEMTVAEYLKDQYNQRVVLDTIKAHFRKKGEWGRRGLNTKVGKIVGLSSAHTGQLLLGKKPITEHFLLKLQEYFEEGK